MKKQGGTIRGRLSDGAPNPIDTHVGARIRLRRTMLGLSQEKLAEKLGITFQQVQKYERGLNRVGASRLWDLAQVLDVSVAFFYEDLDDSSKNSSPRNMNGTLSFSDDSSSFNTDIFTRKDVLELIRHYTSIENPKVARNVLDLVKSLAQRASMETRSSTDNTTDLTF